MPRVRYTSLGSGSEGNALVVEVAESGGRITRVLLDCGFGLREATRRLAARGVAPETLTAVLVTHEHSDHAAGVPRLARRYGIPVYSSHGTWSAMTRAGASAELCAELLHVEVCSHTVFDIDGLRIEPYAVPHDAREPTQFVFGDGNVRLGILTDAGTSTSRILAALDRCDGLVLECNHDPELLARSDYPASLKRRIASDYGHLCNAASAAILDAMDRSRLRRLHAAHLSRQNNRAELAAAALAAVIGASPADIGVATQDDGFDWVEL